MKDCINNMQLVSKCILHLFSIYFVDSTQFSNFEKLRRILSMSAYIKNIKQILVNKMPTEHYGDNKHSKLKLRIKINSCKFIKSTPLFQHFHLL